jgi:hypothetical protein
VHPGGPETGRLYRGILFLLCLQAALPPPPLCSKGRQINFPNYTVRYYVRESKSQVTASNHPDILRAAPWLRLPSQVRICGICGRQSTTVAGFLRTVQFILPILIPPTAPHSSAIIWGWYSRPNWGRRTEWTQSHPHSKKLKKNIRKSSLSHCPC